MFVPVTLLSPLFSRTSLRAAFFRATLAPAAWRSDDVAIQRLRVTVPLAIPLLIETPGHVTKPAEG